MASKARATRLGLLGVVALGLLGARAYLTQAQALKQVFPEATVSRERVFVLADSLRAELARELGYPPREHLVSFHEGFRGEERLGYAIVMNAVGKTLPITFMVGIRVDGTVDQVLLMAFREPRGYEVERAVFRRQYRGKSVVDPIRRGRDIRNISGATLSVDAMSRGVKRALVLYEHLLAPPTGRIASPP